MENEDRINNDYLREIRDFSPGDIVDDYTVVKKIGEGLSGIFYLLRNKNGEELVGKLFKIPLDKYQQQHIKNLIDSYDQNVLRYIDLLEFRGDNILITEYIKGVTLDEKLIRSGSINILERMEIAVQIAQGIAFLDDRSVNNFNLHPGNIFITEYGTIKITGMDSPDPARTRKILIKPENAEKVVFIAPEIFTGGDYKRILTYSFGAILYTLLTDRYPYQGESILKILSSKKHKSLVPPMKYNKSINPDLNGFIMNCLNMDPKKRDFWGMELAEITREYLKKAKIEHTKTRARKERKGTLRYFVIGSAMLLIFFFLLFSSGKEEPVDIVSSGFTIFGKRSDPWGNIVPIDIKDKSVLYTNDGFRIVIEPESVLYLGIINYSSNGSLQLLFPASLSKGFFKVSEGSETMAPGQDEWFRLDDESGDEIIFIIISRDQFPEIMKLLGKALNNSEADKNDLFKLLNTSAEKSTVTRTDRVWDFEYLPGKKIVRDINMLRGSKIAVYKIGFKHE